MSVHEEEFDKYKKPWRPYWSRINSISRINTENVPLLVQSVVEPYAKTNEGELIRTLEIPWRIITERLKGNWEEAYSIPPRIWEELIAAAFDQEGYDEVVLTPRSGDRGRDVIATKHGIGCIRLIGSVKALSPGRLVRHDDVRALAGVLLGDVGASKGVITSTTGFAPGIIEDPYLKPLMPHRLELIDGYGLNDWLRKLSSR